MSHEKLNFTKHALEGCMPQEKPYNIADTKIPGLRLVIYPSGIKTYFVYKKVKGEPQRIKVGRYVDLTIEQARKQAIKINSQIALGGNPMKEKRAARLEFTFKDLADFYYTDYALRHTKRPEDNRKIIEYHILPVLGSKKLTDIDRDRIIRLHSQIGTKYKSMANRAIHVVSAIYNYGIRCGYFKGINPCNGLVKYRLTSRDRFLNPEELQKFFKAVKLEEELFHHFFLMLLFTGARKSNVLAMKWTDIDFTNKRWRISEKETKNQEVNVVLLCDEAIDILAQRYTENKASELPSHFVFPGEGKNGHLDDPKRAFERIRTRMEVENFRMHDLRRTLGSYMAIGGASLPMIGKALNHKSQVSTSIYARLSLDPVLDAVNSAVGLLKDSGLMKMFRVNTEMTYPDLLPRHFSTLLNS